MVDLQQGYFFDSLLIEEDTNPSKINGYLDKEFTHSVISNAILAGMETLLQVIKP